MAAERKQTPVQYLAQYSPGAAEAFQTMWEGKTQGKTVFTR